jgi:NitT/TauT family transport system ATP-binding protein
MLESTEEDARHGRERTRGSGRVRLEHVGVRYDDFEALRDISFEIPPGQFVSLVGPTGCGKSSLLNLVAGLMAPTAGRVISGDSEVTTINPDSSYMFQADALMPWKSALSNVMLGPLLRGNAHRDTEAVARDWLSRVGLRGFEHRYTHQLSGGQKKRVAMAQALINEPPILLMDEPFSALDAQTRARMEQELLSLCRSIGATVLFVTHDLEEAIALSDRVVLLTAGPASTVKSDTAVPLPRPRNVMEARFMPGFAQIYEALWSGLREEVDRVYERSEQH